VRDGVKHGDLDSSLESPEKALDVHMDAEGSNFVCATCHQTEDHKVPGSRYAPTAQDKGEAHLRGKEYKTIPTTCQACHGQAPHKKVAKLNDHTDKVACQTATCPNTRAVASQPKCPGLVDRGAEGPGWQAAGEEERRRPRDL